MSNVDILLGKKEKSVPEVLRPSLVSVQRDFSARGEVKDPIERLWLEYAAIYVLNGFNFLGPVEFGQHDNVRQEAVSFWLATGEERRHYKETFTYCGLEPDRVWSAMQAPARKLESYLEEKGYYNDK